MTRGRQFAVLALAALLALGAGYWISDRLSPGTTAGTSGSGAALLATSMPDLDGKPRQLGQWKGQVVVVNFWATWCEPCREEIPALIDVQRRLQDKGVQIVGIAIDQVDKVKPYAGEMRINYPVLIGELEALELTRVAGNQVGGLPYTIVLDRDGNIAATQLGGITQAKLEALLSPLL